MEELRPEDLEELVDELEEEWDADGSLPQEVENLLQDLQRPDLGTARLNAAMNLGKLGRSHVRIVQALMAVAESDSILEVREAARESLGAPVHQEILQEHPGLMQGAQSAAEKVPQPEYVTSEKQPDGITLTRRWSGDDTSFPVVIGVASLLWNGVMGLALWSFLVGDSPWFAYLILLPFLGVGLLASYFSLSQILNKTVIQLTPIVLSVRHAPLPWPGNRTLPISGVKQVYCRVVARYDKWESEWSFGCYLRAVLDNGDEVDLLQSSLETVRYCEQEIEAYLGIEDTAVAGGMLAVTKTDQNRARIGRHRLLPPTTSSSRR